MTDNEDFKVEVRNSFFRMETNAEAIEKLVREDHDLLTKLSQSFVESFGTGGIYRTRIDDHEKRIRFLERVAFGIIAALTLLEFIVNKIMK